MYKESTSFLDCGSLKSDNHEEETDKLKNEIRTETTLRLDAETRIKTLESAMQEFVDKIDFMLKKQIPEIDYVYKHYEKFKQLLETHE